MRWTQKRAIELMQDWKQSHPCVDCSLRAGAPAFWNYWQMQFDHEPGTKTYNLGTEGKKLDESTLRREMAKCDVVCANCHADRTYHRLKEKYGNHSN